MYQWQVIVEALRQLQRERGGMPPEKEAAAALQAQGLACPSACYQHVRQGRDPNVSPYERQSARRKALKEAQKTLEEVKHEREGIEATLKRKPGPKPKSERAPIPAVLIPQTETLGEPGDKALRILLQHMKRAGLKTLTIHVDRRVEVTRMEQFSYFVDE